jgi:Ca2+-binding EF-hand superfamily protein
MALTLATPEENQTMGVLAVRAVLAVCLALTFLAGAADAQTAPPANLKERFDAADKNHDGALDREEYYQLIIEAFYFRDKNKDGYLVVEELVGVVSPEVFRAVNNKADGKLTIQDWTNALYIDFQRADTNKDGVLSYEELEAYIRTSGR